MVKSIQEAKKICFVNKKEEEILTSPKSPIVLLQKRMDVLPYSIAPKLKKLGIMLPYAPLHYLIFNQGLDILVMTSGNVSGCPIEYKNEKAIDNLKDIVDYFLKDDRKINAPLDDSVVKVVNNKEIISRIGRGYAPLNLSRNVNGEIFASGGDIKNTFSISKGGVVHVSRYLGDISNLDAFYEYSRAIENMIGILNFTPKVIAQDIHPKYMSSMYVKDKKGSKIKVQHHHAHMASCMLEHNIKEKVIGVIYDGLGMGLDFNIWGGEFFVGDKGCFERTGHFKYVKIQGGDSSQKNIWKIGVSYLNSLKNEACKEEGLKIIRSFVKQDKVDNILKLLKHNVNCYKTSSVGRLFDAVASLLGIRERISYDAQGAIELEAILDKYEEKSYKYIINDGNVLTVDYEGIFEGVLQDIKNKIPVSKISSRFHNTIINITVDMVIRLKDKFNKDKVVLSGGVFENEYLLKGIYTKLKSIGFKVFFNQVIPSNDSGISFGQIAVVDENIT